MALQTFDDGSTYDSDTGVATNSPPGYLISDYSSNFAPANAAPGAKNWADVLAYGFGRIVDYKVASINAQNTPPQYGQQVTPATPTLTSGGISMTTVLLLTAAVVGVALVFSGKD